MAMSSVPGRAASSRLTPVGRDVCNGSVGNELREDGLASANHEIEAVACHDCEAHVPAQPRILLQTRSQPRPARAHQIGLIRGHDLADRANGLADSANVSGHYGYAARPRLRDGAGEAVAA